MDGRSVCMSGPVASDVCCSPVNGYCRLMSAKRYIDGALPAFGNVSQSSPLQYVGNSNSDIHSVAANTDKPAGICNGMYSVVSSSFPMHSAQQPELNSWTSSSSPVEEPLSMTSVDIDSVFVDTSTDSIHAGADSMTEAHVLNDHTDRMPELNHYQSEVGGVDECDSEMLPLGDSSVCSVCSDVASGFHCGAYVCEACKVKSV